MLLRCLKQVCEPDISVTGRQYSSASSGGGLVRYSIGVDHLLIQIAVLVFFGRILGEMARRVGQPAVLGELLAGIILGPTVLGKIWPAAQHWIFPGDASHTQLLSSVARLGVLLLLLVTGFEIDLVFILSRGRRLLQVALGGTLVPLLLGGMLGLVLPDTLMQDPQKRVIFALFLAVAMSISAVAVLAKILQDLDVLKRYLAQTMVAVAMTEDLCGWILLSIVVALAGGGFRGQMALQAALGAVTFLALAFTLGRWGVDRMLTYIDDRDGGISMQISVTVFLAMLGGNLTHTLGLEPMLGALVAGILCGQARRFHRETEEALKLIVSSFLSPIFFASAGLKVDLLRVVNPTVIGWGCCIFGVTCLAKLLGASLGAWTAGFRPWECAAFGIGLNARGSMEIIVATIGLSMGILAVETYSIIVLVALGLCLLCPPWLRWAFKHVPVEAEEKARLDQSGSFLHRLRRILVPMRGGPNAMAVTELVCRLNQSVAFDTTLMHVGPDSADFDSLSLHMEEGLERAPTVKKVVRGQPIPLIEKESRRGYQLMILGASRSRGSLFTHAVDSLMRGSGCDVAVVHVPDGWPGLASVEKVMVPTTGTPDSQPSIELAAVLAQAYEAELCVVHVLEMQDPASDHTSLQTLVRVANSLLEQQTETALRYYPAAMGRLLIGKSSDAEILRLAQEEHFDLIVLRGSLRHNLGRAFLGPRAERLLKHSRCPVMVLCS